MLSMIKIVFSQTSIVQQKYSDKVCSSICFLYFCHIYMVKVNIWSNFMKIQRAILILVKVFGTPLTFLMESSSPKFFKRVTSFLLVIYHALNLNK